MLPVLGKKIIQKALIFMIARGNIILYLKQAKEFAFHLQRPNKSKILLQNKKFRTCLYQGLQILYHNSLSLNPL